MFQRVLVTRVLAPRSLNTCAFISKRNVSIKSFIGKVSKMTPEQKIQMAKQLTDVQHLSNFSKKLCNNFQYISEYTLKAAQDPKTYAAARKSMINFCTTVEKTAKSLKSKLKEK